MAKNATLIAVRALDCRGEASYSDVLIVRSSSLVVFVMVATNILTSADPACETGD